MKGALTDGVLPQVLRSILVGHRSGTLTLAHGSDERAIRFRQGQIVHASSASPEEQLGRILVRRGAISEEQLQKASPRVSAGEKLGAILVADGVLPRDVVDDALAEQARVILSRAFSWDTGLFEFTVDDSAGSDAPPLKVETGDLVLASARATHSHAAVEAALGHRGRTVQLSTDPLLRFQRLSLTPADGFLLSRVDGLLSAEEILQLAPMDTEEAERSLFALLCTGVVEFVPGSAPEGRATPLPPRETAPAPASRPPAGHPASEPPAPVLARAEARSPAPSPLAPPPPPRPPVESVGAIREEIIRFHEGLPGRNHFEVLGLEGTATQADVDGAYRRLARRYHPDVHRDPALAEMGSRLVAIFVRVGEAYEAIRDPRKRANYVRDYLSAPVPAPAAAPEPQAPEPLPPEPDPALWVKKATALMKSEQYWDAIQLLEEILPRAQGKVLLTARLTLARAYLQNPRWIREAEQLLRAVVEQDPRNVEGTLLLARLYKGKALRMRAQSLFQKVLDLQPDHEEARRELEELIASAPEPEAESAPRGGLRKLFGGE